jgi:hypothetical protein
MRCPAEYGQTGKVTVAAMALQELVVPLPADSLPAFRTDTFVNLASVWCFMHPSFTIWHQLTSDFTYDFRHQIEDQIGCSSATYRSTSQSCHIHAAACGSETEQKQRDERETQPPHPFELKTPLLSVSLSVTADIYSVQD